MPSLLSAWQNFLAWLCCFPLCVIPCIATHFAVCFTGSSSISLLEKHQQCSLLVFYPSLGSACFLFLFLLSG